MNKSFLSRVILSSLVFSTLAILPNQAVIAQKNPQKPASFWSNISQLLFSNKPPVKPRKGGSRPIDSICMVSPDAPSETRIIWSDRPLFAWQGKVKIIKVTDLNNNTVIFSKNVENTQQFTYTGEPLQPGQTYKLDIFLGEESAAAFVKFQIMESEQRNSITAELKTLENKLQAKQSDPEAIPAVSEAIALAKANYFAKLGLWSDVLQQAYSVQKPSPELDRMLKEIPQQLCKQPKSDGKK
jgi:hypothetical protein